MADATLTLEAKFLDQVSGALKNIERNSQRLEHAVNDSFADMDRRMKKTEATAQKSAKSFGMLGGAVKKLAVAAAGMFAFHRVNQILSESVRLSIVQTEADKNLRATLESTGHAAGMTYDELKKMASGLQEVTNFGDETTQRAQGMLLTFTKIGRDVFPQATEMALNMAAKFNTDVKEASIQLGKALNDPIMGVTALRRVGVQLTEQQEKQIKTFMAVGNVAGAQKVIMGELETQVGGFARATADPMRQFQNAIGDVKEELGASLLPALTETTKEIQAMIKAGKESGELQKFFEDVTDAADKLVGALKMGVRGFQLLNEITEKGSTAFAAEKLTGYLEGLTGLDLGATNARQSVEGLRESVTDLGKLGGGFDMTKQFGPSNLLAPENKPAPVGLTEEQIKAEEERNKQILDAQRMLEDSRIDLIDDAAKREIATVNARFQRHIEAVNGNHQAIKRLEQANQLAIEKIQKDGLEKAAKEQEKEREKASKERERDRKNRELEIIEAQANLGIARAEALKDPLQREIALLELHMNDKLEKVRGNEEAMTLIKEEAELRRLEITKQAEEEAGQARMDAAAQFAGDLGGMLGGFRALEQANQQAKIARLEEAGASKEQIEAAKKQAQQATTLAKTLQKIAIFETVASTWAAATKALNSPLPPPIPQIDAAGRVAMGLGNLAKIKAQQFARGTQFAPGGTALVGERGPELLELPRGTRVNNAAQTKNIRSNATLNAPINITIQGSPDRATVDQIGQAVGARLKAAQRELEQMDFHGVSRGRF